MSLSGFMEFFQKGKVRCCTSRNWTQPLYYADRVAFWQA